MTPHLWIDPSELRQRPRLGVRKELRNGLDVGFRPPADIRPLVEIGIWVETGVIVVDPGDVGFVELLEDGTLRKTKYAEREVVCSVSIGRARGHIGARLLHQTLAHVDWSRVACIPIRIGWTRNITEPVVEEDIILSHRTINGYHVLGKVLNDIGSTGQVVSAMRNFVFCDEAEHALFCFDDLGRT